MTKIPLTYTAHPLPRFFNVSRVFRYDMAINSASTMKNEDAQNGVRYALPPNVYLGSNIFAIAAQMQMLNAKHFETKRLSPFPIIERC